MNKSIFSQCVYDVDNRYVEMFIRPAIGGDAFMLTLTDTSNIEFSESEVELYLTREDLKTVIDRLTEVLNERTN